MTLGTLGAVLGGAAGHDSCCCSAVSEPLLRAHGLRWAGRCGKIFVFLGLQ